MRSTGEPALSDVDALLALPEGLRALGLAVRLPADFPLERLARYQQLASVSVAEQKTVPDFLTGLPSLRKLYVVGPVRSIDPLARMATLEDLTLRSVTAPDLRPLTHLHALRSLDIKLGGLRDLSLLPEVGRLTYLELWQIRGLSDISSVAGLAALEELFLQSLRQVTALPDLSRCSALRRVHLETMKGLTDLTPLAAAPALEELLLVDAGHLQPDVLLPLVGHPTLRTARLGFGSLRKNAQAEALLGIPGPAD
jgi:hypothetical protein